MKGKLPFHLAVGVVAFIATVYLTVPVTGFSMYVFSRLGIHWYSLLMTAVVVIATWLSFMIRGIPLLFKLRNYLSRPL